MTKMTILGATEILIVWFEAQTTFSLSFSPKVKDDFSAAFGGLPDNHKNKSTVLLGLQELAEAGILKVNEISDCKHFVLTRPLVTFPQNVSLDSLTCSHISGLLNDLSDSDAYVSNPQNITCSDIQRLIGLTITLAQKPPSSGEKTETPKDTDFSQN